MTRAATGVGLPVAISSTVETDGRLPSGQPLGEAVDAATALAYDMITCAHPTHVESVLDGPWVERVRGVRANALRRSHAGLDAAVHLDGGCGGIVHRHFAANASSWT